MPRHTRIALTLGDPAGIGPDVALQLLDSSFSNKLVIFTDRSLLESRAALLKLDPTIIDRTEIIEVTLQTTITPGLPNLGYAPWVLDTLNQATEACLSGNCDALVTGPVHKGLLNEAGFPFLGHTEYLAEKSRTPEVVMSFFGPQLILGLLTTHLPLSAVPEAIRPEHLKGKLTIFYHAVKRYLKRPPRIAVLGLNPHAGENGFLGREEIDIIQPTLDQLAQNGIALEGPVSADSAFSPAVRGQYDALFAMYHDQGLCGLKAIDFGESVNVTLGLPFIRTSVDHGTAYDKAGTLLANSKSLRAAIQAAEIFIRDK
ncbi:MAG: 4-hydroxythreonine-4-phosphate dehydrogenase PdxA [Gammaproteobacteria bacterium]